VMPMLVSMDKRILWLTVSNAADKSSRISAEDLAVALASFKASVTANRAVSVEYINTVCEFMLRQNFQLDKAELFEDRRCSKSLRSQMLNISLHETALELAIIWLLLY